jgi:hypothetical protein
MSSFFGGLGFTLPAHTDPPQIMWDPGSEPHSPRLT